MEEKEILCADCGEAFILRFSEREALSLRKRAEPKYCPLCARRFRSKKEQERKEREDLEWQRRKAEDQRAFVERLREWPVVSLSDIEPKPDENPLYIIGNGFDMMHGARSSYYDFSRTIGKNSRLRYYLEAYLKVDDLWADFEGALAKIDVELMSSSRSIDTFLDGLGAYDEDAGAAEFFAAAEMAASPITAMNTELKEQFRAWIDSLVANTDDRPLKGVLRQGKVLNFNYTEFIEDLYGIDDSRICYIHGCRKTRKGLPKEELILGHMPGASDQEFEFEDSYSGINLSGNRAQMIYDAQQTALGYIAEADEGLTKNCRKIIEKHRDFFAGLTDVDTVITIGHSLYPVDWDYFREIIRNNRAAENIHWRFGCHSGTDLDHIQSFMEHFGIPKYRVAIFRTDLINVSLLHAGKSTPVKPDIPLPRRLGASDDRRWLAEDENGRVTVKDTVSGETKLTRIFSTYMSGAVFDRSGACLLLVARGLWKGVFLFRRTGSEWQYLRELEGIQNQGVITPRLHRILLKGDRLVFIYNSRIRMYDIDSGTLVYNHAARRTFEQTFEGEDLTGRFQKIFKTGFY